MLTFEQELYGGAKEDTIKISGGEIEDMSTPLISKTEDSKVGTFESNSLMQQSREPINFYDASK